MIHRAALAGLLLAAGCSVLAPRPDPSRFFLLDAAVDGPAASPAVVAGAVPRSLEIGPVRVPAYLDRSEIATRGAANRIQYAPADRWAEPLGAGVARVLAQNLGTLLAPRRLYVYPELAPAPDAALRIDVLRFETRADGAAELHARWALTARERHVARETLLTQAAAGSDAEAAVGALSRTLGRLSMDIAETLRGIEDGGR